MNERDVRDCLEQIRGGDTAAFAQLVEAHKDAVYRLGFRMMGNAEDAEELSQDVFLTAWKSLSGYRGDAKFSVWLYRITYNAGINRLRKKKLPVVDLENRELPEHADLDHHGPLQQLHQTQRQQVIEQAMQQLAPIDRSLLQLFYLEELSIKEIVPILQLTESNAKVRLLRARKRLHHSLRQLLREETEHLL